MGGRKEGRCRAAWRKQRSSLGSPLTAREDGGERAPQTPAPRPCKHRGATHRTAAPGVLSEQLTELPLLHQACGALTAAGLETNVAQWRVPQPQTVESPVLVFVTTSVLGKYGLAVTSLDSGFPPPLCYSLAVTWAGDSTSLCFCFLI